MRFSVVIPYFDKYDCFFDECLNSVLSQKYRDFECIIIACKHEIKKLIAHKQINNKRTHIFESIRVDQSSKRNIGINKSKGEYIIFLDCDDMLDTNFLAHSASEIDNYNPDLIAYGFTRDFNEIGKIVASPRLIIGEDNCRCEIFYDYMLDKQKISNINFDSSCWKVYRKEFIDKNNIRFQDGLKCAEDVLFVRCYAVHIKTLVINDSYCSYYWRINPKSTMNNIDSGFFDLEPFFTSLEKTLIELPIKYYSNFRMYLNVIIKSRIDSALALSKNGDYQLLHLISEYKKSKYIRNAIQISFFKGKFYIIVALSIKFKIYFIFSLLLKSYINRRGHP